jgi:hypothetical protein
MAALRALPALARRARPSSSYSFLGGAAMRADCRTTLDAWHSAVDGALGGASEDELRSTLAPRMAPDCIFRPPTYYKEWRGRDETMLLLHCVSEVFGKSFVYGRQWLSDDGREWALEFTANIGDSGKGLQGIDLVSLDEQGLIKEFTVLARPPNAVAELKSAMMRKVPVRLAGLKAKQALGLQ